MKKIMNVIKSEINTANNDLTFVKVASVYLYVIIGASAMLIGLVIGVNN